MDADNGVLIAEFDTGADHAIEFLFHFCVAALHGIEIEFGFVFALYHARSSAASHANAIGRSTDFGDEHMGFRLFFLCMTRVHLTDPTAEHNGFDPFSAFSIGQAHTVRSRVALYEGFAEFVAVIRGPIAGFNCDLQGGSEVIGILKFGIFPGQIVSGNIQITHAIRRCTRYDERAAARGLHIPDASAGTCFCAGKRRDTRWKVVRFCCKDDVAGAV